MGFTELLMILTITVCSFIVAVFSFRQWNQPRPVVARQKAEAVPQQTKDLIFVTDGDREVFVKSLAESRPIVVVVWFISDKYKVYDLYKGLAKEVRVFEHSELPACEWGSASTCVVWGKHPLLKVEEMALRPMERFRELFIVSSLDDTLLQYFGGEEVKSLITRLGHRSGESIEHRLISESIRKAQEQIGAKVLYPTSAASSREWFLLNLPEKG